MKFFNALSFLSLAGLFTSTLAAPTPSAELSVAEPETVALQKRCDVCDSLGNLVTVVESFTAQINVTVSQCDGIEISVTEKAEIFVSIQASCKSIIAAIYEFCGELTFNFIEAVSLSVEELELIAHLCVHIAVEISCTLLNAIRVLGCSILELLGTIAADFLGCLIAFITKLSTCYVGFLVVFEVAIKASLTIVVGAFPGFCTCNITV